MYRLVVDLTVDGTGDPSGRAAMLLRSVAHSLVDGVSGPDGELSGLVVDERGGTVGSFRFASLETATHST
jgi:hypothetical protein